MRQMLFILILQLLIFGLAVTEAADGHTAETDTQTCMDDATAKVKAAIENGDTLRDKLCRWQKNYLICVAKVANRTASPDEMRTVFNMFEKHLLAQVEKGVICSFNNKDILRVVREGGGNGVCCSGKFQSAELKLFHLLCLLAITITLVLR